jgi:hypothetical protein
MREQFFEAAIGLGRKALQHVFKILVRIVSVELRGLDEG